MGDGIWELGAASWELGAESREPGAGSWELGAGSCEQGAGSWELGAVSWELGAAQINPTVATKISGYAETLNPCMPKLAVLLAAHTIYLKLLRLNCC